MAKAIRYVKSRAGVLYYERRVPKSVTDNPDAFRAYFNSAPTFRCSLKTKSQSEALRRAAAVSKKFDLLVAAALGSDAVQSTSSDSAKRSKMPLTDVSPDLLSEISEEFSLNTIGPWQHQFILSQQDTRAREELARMANERELDAEKWSESLAEPGFRSTNPKFEAPIQTAEAYAMHKGINAPQGSAALSLLAVAIREGTLAGEAAVDDLLSGHSRLPILLKTTRANRSTSAERGLTLRDAVEQYTSERSLNPKTKREAFSYLAIFEEAVGNKRLSDIERRDFHSFIEFIKQKPIGGKSQGSIEREISPRTVKKKMSLMSSAIEHAISKDRFIGPNPAKNIKVDNLINQQDKAIMPAKRPFNVGELNLLFQHSWFSGCASESQDLLAGRVRLSDSRFWVPIVALFTGCRAAELGGLMLNEVHLEDAHPHIHVRDNVYRTTKKGYARFVPILDGLRAIGFDEYVSRVRAKGADRLFPDWVLPKSTKEYEKRDTPWSNAKIIRAFNRTVIQNSLRDRLRDDARKEVTFHSFRGAFKSMLGLQANAVSTNIINEVTGHAKGEMDQRYVGMIPLEETYPAIRSCGWPGLVLPTSPYT